MIKGKVTLSLIALALIVLSSAAGVSGLHIAGYITLDDGFLSRTVETVIVRPKDRLIYTEEPDRFAGYQDTAGRMAEPCPGPGAGTAVLFAFGQSNASNIGAGRRKGQPGLINFNIFDGKCYRATDPLLGSSGTGGAVWTALGNRLILEGALDSVIVVPIAIGGSSINRWADPRDLGARIAFAGAALQDAGIKVTHVLVIHGEADHHAAAAWSRLRPSEFRRLRPNGSRYSMRSKAYAAHFLTVRNHLKSLGINGPVYVAVKTRCGDTGPDIEGPVSKAQRDLALNYDGIHPGPNINAFADINYRSDLCHLSDAGIEKTAKIWAKILIGNDAIQTNPN
jgi:hypothetical protein